MGTKQKVAFLDRDGVLNHDRGYVHTWAQFEWIDGVMEALGELRNRGYALIVVTNQSGIGRGYYTESDYRKLTTRYRRQLAAAGVDLLDILHCPHKPDAHCSCRKPKPGLLLQAASQHPIDLNASIMFGDKLSDMQAAAAAGVSRGVLLQSEPEPIPADLTMPVTSATSLWHYLNNSD